MPCQQASPIHLSPIQQEVVQRMVHRTKSEQRLVKRGHIILEAAQGTSNTKIAHQWQVDYETVRRWRDRWHAAEARVQGVEGNGQPKNFSQGVQRVPTHEQRPGAPAPLTFEPLNQIQGP